MSDSTGVGEARPNRERGTRVEVLPTIGRRILRVARVHQLTPRYRRITFRFDDPSTGFPFRLFAPADHIKLFFPDPRTGILVVPVITERGWQVPPDAGAPLFRDYTVRGFDAGTGELTVDFVVHPHGVAGSWAARARPGDQLGQLGPRGHVLFPVRHERYLVAGDETALPVIMRALEEAPVGSRVTAVVEVDDVADEQPLRVRPGVAADIRWVHRGGSAYASPLEDAIRAVPLTDAEPAFVFVAGEATSLIPIRRYLRGELRLPQERVEVDGYWKRGIANLDHHAKADGDEE
ncbi:siderophore-interacting protein [Microbacterium sp. RG1]|uniref:siderophore-interacting protein n=1 Tax=Microbacterium sp. RG1 TaxID=2489212 RepID=UPI0010CA6030|nr:siderophore-interacting protein [Microbacterium sp. RG1]QCQ16241.1 siderophore-interacting protein [Microbacterium sp. RG1]